MAKYYFVTTLLPPLKIGVPPEIDSRELDFILKLNLTKEDLQKAVSLRRLIEIENIRNFWRGEPIDPGGNYDEKEIEENLFHLEAYPAYVFDFMEKHPDTTSRLAHFPELLRQFFHDELKKQDGFVLEYLKFEWEWRLVFVALRANSLGRDLEKEMQYEDPEDPFIEQILEQKNQKIYQPPEKYKALKDLFDAKKLNPLELQKALSEWRFDSIENMVGWHTFDVYRVLGYVVQLKICEKWLKLDKKKGLEIVEKVAKGVS
jgi:hypothetical protein